MKTPTEIQQALTEAISKLPNGRKWTERQLSMMSRRLMFRKEHKQPKRKVTTELQSQKDADALRRSTLSTLQRLEKLGDPLHSALEVELDMDRLTEGLRDLEDLLKENEFLQSISGFSKGKGAKPKDHAEYS